MNLAFKIQDDTIVIEAENGSSMMIRPKEEVIKELYERKSELSSEDEMVQLIFTNSSKKEQARIQEFLDGLMVE